MGTRHFESQICTLLAEAEVCWMRGETLAAAFKIGCAVGRVEEDPDPVSDDLCEGLNAAEDKVLREAQRQAQGAGHGN